jgi:hypothetical protein
MNVSLLGMPEESDWVLYAPYSDKSLLRNVLAYQIARSMGRYATRTRFCEVVLNGEYWGVYVLEEKIKRDKNRVDIKKLEEDEITGIDLPVLNWTAGGRRFRCIIRSPTAGSFISIITRNRQIFSRSRKTIFSSTCLNSRA